ncbi:FxsA family protein [Paenibacillus thiaminolyticus]|uniref:FxsA family protein n=2 Tax=Paenibacillus thiaminolyticus TaxID=49283 RepID=A0A378ZJC1_PANTH|nr:FxsA family protein [Paenibacillus thiaminolyticus]MCY9538645.1 FxsA family protein [Paenibacillus thiaminolyticus]MCY9605557.1 FxsA family protein [Paenibacillus thiaminolyticus]MCY9606259.1 FxsA family protein [Paenibacillus thiaminolyticus]MCY9612009.1 FxsA family protein [Paenibacillus thiaminolyticus]MCY9618030.1 FxsA family protein [Paenibacillus thiaminolyticus]
MNPIMIGILIVLTLIPALEIYGFLLVSGWIGGWNTFLLILLTSVIGAIIARYEAAQVWGEAQKQLQARQVPGRAVIDGLCILAGGVLLLTPGFFTDIVGFTLVFPLTRPLYRHYLLKWIEKKMKDGSFIYYKRY